MENSKEHNRALKSISQLAYLAVHLPTCLLNYLCLQKGLFSSLFLGWFSLAP